MMIQKNANVYIYDYNSILSGSGMICYDFNSLSYIFDAGLIGYNFGEVLAKGTASTDGEYGFEEMINNVEITSSLYANNPLFDEQVGLTGLSEKKSTGTGTETDKYKLELYEKYKNIENLNGAEFAVYTNKEGGGELTGLRIPSGTGYSSSGPAFRMTMKEYMTGSDRQYYLNVKLDAYANTRNNPFDNEEEGSGYGNSIQTDMNIILVYCNLYVLDDQGNMRKYFTNRNINQISQITGRWVSVNETPLSQGQLVLVCANMSIFDSTVSNMWLTNSDVPLLPFFSNSELPGWIKTSIPEKLYAAGFNIPLPVESPVNGYAVFEITNYSRVGSKHMTLGFVDIGNDIMKNYLFNNISLSITDADKKQAPTDDYEFKSYVNKKVAADYEGVTLKVISANEEQLPIGRANLLRRENGAYSLQRSFTRAGQTDILERLLMCTVHSNYTVKNEKFSVDINGCDNPAMSYIEYSPILTGKYLVAGYRVDFGRAKTTLSAVGFSADTAQLSSIPYD
jgi:hypothetical protein